jgi:transposase
MANKRVSDLAAFVEACDHPFVIGVDVHKKSYSIALRRFDGAIKTWVAPAEPRRLIETIETLSITVERIAYEAGPTGFGLARALKEASLPVIVAAPSRIPRPVAYGPKTDRLDCAKLAEYAAKGFLKPIALPTEQEEADRSLVRRRHDLADALRKVKQRIRSHLLFLGAEEPKGLNYWSKTSIALLEKIPLASSARLTLKSLLRELNYLQQELQRVRRDIARVTNKEEHQRVIACLQSVPGVGPVVSSTFRLEVFQPQRFQRAEELTSYLGLAPLARQSGENKPRARLRPVGQTRLRSLLVEAAWTFKAKNPQAEQWYRKQLSQSGLPQKAITALARKLAVILWRLCLEKRRYRYQMATA